MHEDGKPVTERIQNFVLEIIQLLPGEDYEVLKKHSDCDSLDTSCLAPEEFPRTQSPSTESPPHTLIHERKFKNNELKILKLTHAIIRLLTGEVPVRCEDVTIYLSMEEWEYLAGHWDLYKDVMEDHQNLGTLDIQSTDNSFLEIQLMQRMLLTSANWSLVGQRIRHLTQEMIFLLSVQGDVIMKNPDENLTHSSAPIVAKENNIQNPGRDHSPHSLTKNDEKILELTNAIIRLLTGEVPVRYKDVTVYLSMDEWEYLEGHRYLYKDLMMEDHNPKDLMMEDHHPKDLMMEDHHPKDLMMEDHHPKDVMMEDHHPKDVMMEDHHLKDVMMGDHHPKDVMMRDHHPKDVMMRDHHPKDVMMRDHQPLSTLDASNSNHKGNSVHSPVTTYELIPEMGRNQGENLHNTNLTSKNQNLCFRKEPEGLLSYEQGELIDLFTSTDHTQAESTPLFQEEAVSHEQCIPVHIKGELDPWEEGDLTDISNNTVPTEYICRDEYPSDEDVTLTDTAPAEHILMDHTSHPNGEEFTLRKQTLADTTVRVRGRNKILPCNECGKKCAGKAAYTSHQRNHVVERMYSCASCQKYFSAHSDIGKQVGTHKEKKRTCSVCKVRCARVSNILRHYCIHLDKEINPCSECRKNYIGKHKPVASEKVRKPVSCSECGKVFDKLSRLIIHQRTHTGEKPFSCADCGKCFTSKGSLFTHQMSHTGFMRFPCAECGKCFKYKSRLLEHQQTHTGEKPFLCPDCGKSFTRKSTLVHHQYVHTGELKFACSECGLRFAYKSVLVTHEKTHTGEKPFFCSLCGERYTRKSSLVAHHLFHIGEKPFSCSKCEKRFTNKSSLKYHENTHAREKQPVLNVGNVVLVGQIMFV